MVKLQHPKRPTITRTVPADQADAWLAAGWVLAPESETLSPKQPPGEPSKRKEN